ncbi:MAG: hypothetical protein U5L45_05190 [Saprospiraceae bacterium]|nr:hypothetical protein [Saprospiraceae bacterium]
MQKTLLGYAHPSNNHYIPTGSFSLRSKNRPKEIPECITNCPYFVFIARFARKTREDVFRFWASPKIETPFFVSEASYKNEIRTICYTLKFLWGERVLEENLRFFFQNTLTPIDFSDHALVLER